MKRNSPEKLTKERELITEFTSSRLKIAPSRVPVKLVFRAYKKWRGGRTFLTIDSFGKLLPNTLKRKTVGFKGKTCRAVLGVKLK